MGDTDLYCTKCGAPRIGPAPFCPSCGRPFVAPSGYGAPVMPSAPVSYPYSGAPMAGTSTPSGDRRLLGIVLLIIGVVLALVGIGLLVAASVVSSGVASFNHICSMNPSCVPEADPSGGLTVGGVALTVLGGMLAVGGFVAYWERR